MSSTSSSDLHISITITTPRRANNGDEVFAPEPIHWLVFDETATEQHLRKGETAIAGEDSVENIYLEIIVKRNKGSFRGAFMD